MDNNNFFWGGLTQNIFLKIKLDREPPSHLFRKILFFIFIAWLPLLIFNIFQSTIYNHELKISFINDYVIWARFFIALPALFISERIIRFHVGNSINHFIESGIVAENNIVDYKTILLKFQKIRDSKIIEVIILIFSYAVVLFYWRVTDKDNLSATWIFNTKDEISPAGYWYYFVSAPIFQFILYRMIWKFILWAAFLFKVSRIKLNLIPTDPDLSGGLRFLGIAQLFFGLIGLCQNSVISAEIAEWIILNNTHLVDYKITIVINVLALSLLYLLPLTFFIHKLFKVKLKGELDYGVVAHRYINAFDNKWVKGINPRNEELLGTSDMQSLADLFNSYQVVQKMTIVPIDIKQIILLIIIIAVPYLPLLTFVIPPNEILGYLIKMFI